MVRKPAGISTIPFGDESPDERDKTLDALVRVMQRLVHGPVPVLEPVIA